MKKICFALLLITGMVSCSSETGAPTAAIDGMFTAMKNGNLDDMKKFITKSDIAMLDAGEKLLAGIDPEAIKKIKEKMADELKSQLKNVSYTVKNEKIDGDHATLEAEVTENLPADQAGSKKTSHTFELVKEDGAWKIALTKPGNEMFNSMKGNMGPDKGGMKEGLERLKNMDPDSLKILINKGLQMMDSLHNKDVKQ